MGRTGALDELIRRARRRHLANLVIQQTVQAACIAMGGLIVLLLLGTQILDWPWLAALFGAGLAAGLWRLRAQVPSRYAVAQSIDRNLNLLDHLSTAFCYNRLLPERSAPAEVRAAQLAQAERLAAEVPLERAAPFRAPRSLYLMAALGLVASSLFALRYGIARRLDLRPPLARVVFDAFHFFASQPDRRQPRKNARDRRLQELLKQFGLSLDNQSGNRADDSQPAPAPNGNQTAQTEAKQEPRSSRDGLKPLDVRNERSGTSPAENGRDASSPESGENQTAANSSDPRGQTGGQAPGKQASNAQSESDSLLNKFRDAMANLLSRLKPQPRNGAGQQMADAAQGRPDQGRSQQPGSQKGPQAGGQQSDPQSGGDPQGEQQSEGQQQAQSGAGKQAGSEAEQASREGHSGIGKEDGSKDVRQADQLAAMGKISEIFGKRAQNITGEVMVEVASGTQQLRTPYSQQTASHAEAGGEIHRDEIPLAYQRYVQQYFEEVRKAAPHSSPAKPQQ